MGYEEWERVYREVPERAIPWESWMAEPALIEIAKKIGKGKALDLGCGFGTHAIALAKMGFDVTGIDISHTAIERARELAKEAGVKCVFMVGDATRLRFAAESFNLIFDRGCFHHIRPEDRHRFVEGLWKVLKSGGWMLLMAFSKRNISQAADEEDVAFRLTKSKTFDRRDVEKIFGERFEILKVSEAPHSEPGGGTVWLLTALMRKK